MVPLDGAEESGSAPSLPTLPTRAGRPGRWSGRSPSLLEGGLQLLEGRFPLLHLLGLLLLLLLLGSDFFLEAAGHVDGLHLGWSGGEEPQGWRAPCTSMWAFPGTLPAVPAQLPLPLAPALARALHSPLGASVSPFRAWCSINSHLMGSMGGLNEVTHIWGLLHSTGPMTSDVSFSCLLFWGVQLPTSPIDKP